MRTLIFTLLILVMGDSYAQTSQPYQPDANGDGLINAEDMLSFLTVFNTQWGPDLSVPCDYQGTALETLMADLLNGDATMDSLYFAYSIYDSAEIFMPECPDPVTVYNLVERSGTILSFERVTFPDGRLTVTSGEEIDGHYVFFDVRHNPEFGVHSIEFGDAAIVAEAAPFFDGLWHYANDHIGLPLPSSWYLDNLGIHFPAYEGTLNQYGDFQFVPYWSTPASEDSGEAGEDGDSDQ
tara:strand:- start:827 stop:1540 length:714 start_codon:yes stop_codon:yes gene_type:complete